MNSYTRSLLSGSRIILTDMYCTSFSNGIFRDDLHYRLNIVAIYLPLQLQLQRLKEASSDEKGLVASIEKAEAEKIVQVLEQTDWKKSEAALILGISRKTLWEKIKKYNIGKE